MHDVFVYILLVLICKYCCCKLLCVRNIAGYLCCMCMYVGEHICRPSLLCNPVIDKINNNIIINISCYLEFFPAVICMIIAMNIFSYMELLAKGHFAMS